MKLKISFLTWWLVLFLATPFSLKAFYDPGLQRWINRDPIQEKGGLNLFNFVLNNPIGWFDFMGLAPDINWCQKGDPAGKNSGLVKDSSSGTYSVMGHGTPKTIEDDKGNILTPKQLAKIIQADKKYKPGMPVRLLSCNTGKGFTCFAEELSKLLKACVFAPGDFVGVSDDGTIWVGPEDPKNHTILDENKSHKAMNVFCQ